MFFSLQKAMRGARRRPLTGKTGNKDYYKGSGGGSMGYNTKRGKYLIDATKLRQFVVPNLEDCLLKPYVER